VGRFHSPRDLAAEYAIAPDNLYLIDRATVALLSVATVGLVYWTMKRVAGVRSGLLSALFLALCYLHVRDSHYGTVDIPLTFMCTLAVGMMVRAHQAPSTRANLLAALCVGLAISTKYNAVVLGLPLALMHLFQLNVASPQSRLMFARGLAGSAAAVVVGFVVGTPYSILDFATFSHDLVSEFANKSGAVPSPDLGAGVVYHAIFTLPHGVGWPLLLLAAIGCALALRSDFRAACLLLGFPLGWYVAVGQSHFVFVRYAVPLAPSICMFAAWGIEQADQMLKQRRPDRPLLVTGAVALAVVVAILPTGFNTFQWDRLVRRVDTRVLATEWIEAHVRPAESVGLVGPTYIQPDLWSTPAQMERASNGGTTGQGRRLRNELRLAHIQKVDKPTFELRTFLSGNWVDTLDPQAPASAQPRYVVVPVHPAWMPVAGDEPALAADYHPVASFVGFTSEARAAVFDRHDAVYFPFAHFDGIERPGPNLTIFERNQRP